MDSTSSYDNDLIQSAKDLTVSDEFSIESLIDRVDEFQTRDYLETNESTLYTVLMEPWDRGPNMLLIPLLVLIPLFCLERSRSTQESPAVANSYLSVSSKRPILA
jgi:hypothetical protein